MVNAGKTCSQGNYLPGRLVFLKPRLSSHIEGLFLAAHRATLVEGVSCGARLAASLCSAAA